MAVVVCGMSVQATTIEPDGSVIVESRSGGKNFANYSENESVWPNAWSNSSAKSTAEGTTSGVGSRFNSSAGFGAWFAVAPELPANPLGMWEVYITTANMFEHQATSTETAIEMSGASGLPSSTNAFDKDLSMDKWSLVGSFPMSDSGVVSVTFIETSHSGETSSSRWIADGVKFVPVPEPATLAFLALGGLFMVRRRS